MTDLSGDPDEFEAIVLGGQFDLTVTGDSMDDYLAAEVVRAAVDRTLDALSAGDEGRFADAKASRVLALAAVPDDYDDLRAAFNSAIALIAAMMRDVDPETRLSVAGVSGE